MDPTDRAIKGFYCIWNSVKNVVGDYAKWIVPKYDQSQYAAL